ncbi:MAG: hypothetical protein Q7R81_06520 [Candidatus Peregrinibacteria bacterium]|nr:hypothetical protein [Candidatus Peregrinibacteria bacterium]
MTHRRSSAMVLGVSLLLSACATETIVQTGNSFSVSEATSPAVPLAAEEFSSSATDLPAAVADLNHAELAFIAAANAEGGASVDAQAREIAAQAMRVATIASSLSTTMAAQVGGEASAAQYADVARISYSLVLEVQDIRERIAATGDAKAEVALVADYGSRLWNPTVTEGVSTVNPFIAHLADASSAEPVEFLTGDQVDQVTSQLSEGSELQTWLALSTQTVEKTVTIEEADTSVNPFDATVLRTLTTASGQSDSMLARQVAGAHLVLLSGGSEPQSSLLIPIAFAAGKEIKIRQPTGIFVVDFYNFGKDNPEVVDAAKKKFIPVFKNGMKAAATEIEVKGTEAVAKKYEPAVADFLKGAGVAIPEKKGSVPVTNTNPTVGVNITIDSVVDVAKADAEKRGYAEGEKEVKFTVNWTAQGGNADFVLSCNGQVVEADGASRSQVSLNWPLKVGQHKIWCAAVGQGGANLGGGAVSVTISQSVQSSSLSTGFSVASASASSAEQSSVVSSKAASSAAASSQVSTTGKASSALSLPAKSSAASSVVSSQAVSSDPASSAAASSVTGGGDTSWIEGEVKKTEADLLARKFDATAVAIVTADLRACYYDEAAKGKNQSQAKSACAAFLKKQAASSTSADPDEQPLPTVTTTAVFTETIAGGPKTVFTTTVILTADFKTKSVVGTISGASGAWEDRLWCYNQDDPDEIYQETSGRYTSAYEGKLYAGLGEGGTFTMPLVIGGTTNMKMTQEYTHEECTHLNSSGVVDSYSGKGTLVGTVTTDDLWTITTHWVTDDGVVTVNGSYAGQ